MAARKTEPRGKRTAAERASGTRRVTRSGTELRQRSTPLSQPPDTLEIDFGWDGPVENLESERAKPESTARAQQPTLLEIDPLKYDREVDSEPREALPTLHEIDPLKYDQEVE